MSLPSAGGSEGLCQSDRVEDVTQLLHDDVGALEAGGRRQQLRQKGSLARSWSGPYLAELLCCWREGEASSWQHELAWPPVHLGLEGHLDKEVDRRQEQKAVAHHLTCVGATAALLAAAPRPGVTGAVGGGRRCLEGGVEGGEGGLVSTWGLGWKEGREVSCEREE